MHSGIARYVGANILGLSLVLATSGTCAAQQCIGDCNEDGRVTVDELIRVFGSALCIVCLEPLDPPCPGFEPPVAINTLVSAVDNALSGCAEIGTAGISAACSLSHKAGPADKEDLIFVTLAIVNDSGSTITNVTANALDVRGGAFTVRYVPLGRSQLSDGRTVRFVSILSSNASLAVNASASAIGPGGEAIPIGPVACE